MMNQGIKVNSALVCIVLLTPCFVNASPGVLDLDYTFARPLYVESRIVGAARVDIIRPKSRTEKLPGHVYMAEVFGDDLLVLRCMGSGLVKVVPSEGAFSFIVHDQRSERGVSDQYAVIREWGGGKVFAFFIVDAGDRCGDMLTVSTTSDQFEVTPDGSLLLNLPAGFSGLENCPLSERPFDVVKYLFTEQGFSKAVIDRAIKPYCAS